MGVVLSGESVSGRFVIYESGNTWKSHVTDFVALGLQVGYEMGALGRFSGFV